MKIVEIEIRACRGDTPGVVEASKLAGGAYPPFLVVSMKTDEGLTGVSYGFATLDPMVGAHNLSAVKQFFLGRDPIERERAWQEFYRFDRHWTLSPVYAYGPFDNACWDIVAQQADLPLFRLLGSVRDRIPTYVSSMFLPDPDSYTREARDVVDQGFRGYKVHPPGELGLDIDVFRAVRDAVGPDFALMADPVGPYDYPTALRVGRELERLGYLWMEEPLQDSDWFGQHKLSRDLDIPIVGTETLPHAHRSSALYLAEEVVDAVRTDVSWRGGVSGVLKTAYMADAFGARCELHTCIYHGLDLINLHCAAALANCSYFELLYPLADYTVGLAEPIRIIDGYAYPPSGPGLGIAYDWDAIDDRTVAVL